MKISLHSYAVKVKTSINRWCNKQICKWFGHDLQYIGYAGCKATFNGKPWPFKCNYAVYVCKWCNWDNKQESVRIEDLWRSDKRKPGKRVKRSLI